MEERSAVGMLGSRDELLVRGFLPRLCDSGVTSAELYGSCFATYVECDLRRLVNVPDLTRFETFVRLLAGRVGQLVNLSALAGDVGVTSTTLGGWLSALEASFLVVRLTPYHANIGKRLVKTPKLYFTEPGLLAWLLQIDTPAQAARDPLLGELYENLVIVEALKGAYNQGLDPRLSFYRDGTGLEVDLICEFQRRPFAVEIQAGSTFWPETAQPLRKFRALHGNLVGSAIVYGGETPPAVGGVEVRNHAETAQLLYGNG